MNPQILFIDGTTRYDLEQITPAIVAKLSKGCPRSYEIRLQAPMLGKTVLARVHYTPARSAAIPQTHGVDYPPATPARIDVTSDYPAIEALLKLTRAAQ